VSLSGVLFSVVVCVCDMFICYLLTYKPMLGQGRDCVSSRVTRAELLRRVYGGVARDIYVTNKYKICICVYTYIHMYINVYIYKYIYI